MIVKRNFSPLKVWQYIKVPATISLCWALMVFGLAAAGIFTQSVVSFAALSLFGSALAIFIAFRNNSSYSRWWEARTAWSGLLTASRTLGRLMISFTDSHSHQPSYIAERSEQFKKEMIHLVIAFAHSLRQQLRGGEDDGKARFYTGVEGEKELSGKYNKPQAIQMLLSKKLYKAMADGTLGGFDSFQIEGQILALTTVQSTSERIKSTPLPRQYDFFTRVFVYLFNAIVPFGILSLSKSQQSYELIILFFLSVVVSFVYIIMERTGAANEDPFENLVTDVPLSYICNTIERDLLEMLGEKTLPEKIKPVNGYLN